MSGSFVGKITAAGYEPPDGTMVNWTRFGKGIQSYPLRKWYEWDGSNTDLGYHGRYAVGKGNEVEGMFIREIGVEQQGGEAYAILTHLLGRPARKQEYTDFAIANGNGRVLTAEDWPRLTGRPSPIQQPPGKKKPVDPPPPPVTPPVLPPAGLAPLSPASQRVEELRSIVLDFYRQNPELRIHLLCSMAIYMGWHQAEPFAVEALRFYRRLRQRLGDTRAIPKEDS